MISLQRAKILGLIFPMLFFTACSSSNQDEKENNIPADSTSANTLMMTDAYSEDADTTGLTVLSGNLNYSGAEPFARPTLFVSDSVAYLLTGDSLFINETYGELNGKYATLYGVVTDSSRATFRVRYYRVPDLK